MYNGAHYRLYFKTYGAHTDTVFDLTCQARRNRLHLESILDRQDMKNMVFK